MSSPTAAAPPKKELTPQEYQLLPDREKVRYKDLVVRVPHQWGGVLLPVDSGPYRSPTDRAVHIGDVANLMGLYNQSLFELQHPRVKVEYVHFDMWTENFRSAYAVALSARRAPSYFMARDLPQTIYQGMLADLTPLVQKWDQFRKQPEGAVRDGTVNGRVYTIAANEVGATIVRYRKDWFREAGIFNERGEPGPRSDWTWSDFRRIAKQLTDPARNRHGFAAQMGELFYGEAHALDYYIPDPTGKQTWVFNDQDPELLTALKNARDMVNVDRSVFTSVTTGWYEWHNEFDAGRAAMISSFSPHPPRDMLTAPFKLGKDKPFGETVGMAPMPRGDNGYDPMRPVTNPVGFDPTLEAEELAAAFEWCKSYFYGDIFANRMRQETQEARAKGRQSTLYVELLTLPYQPTENLLDRPLEEVFPRDYTELYRRIRASHAPPLPREFGLREPPRNEMDRALKAMYSEAITGSGDLKELVQRTARLFNSSFLKFRGDGDREGLRKFVAARSEFYQRHFPKYHAGRWREKLATYWKVP